MNSYSETEVFSNRAVKVLDYATQIVNALPGRERNKEWRCHEVARIVRRLLSERYGAELILHVVDGKFDRVDHSWIAFLDSRFANKQLVILDPYAVGALPQVQMLSCGFPLAERASLYKPDHLPRSDIDEVLVTTACGRLREMFASLA